MQKNVEKNQALTGYEQEITGDFPQKTSWMWKDLHKTFPLKGGRWLAGGQTDEGASRKWFGAPGRRAPQNKAVPHRYSGRMLSAPTPPLRRSTVGASGRPRPTPHSLCHPERQRRIRLSRPFAERQETGERILRLRIRMTEKEGGILPCSPPQPGSAGQLPRQGEAIFRGRVWEAAPREQRSSVPTSPQTSTPRRDRRGVALSCRQRRSS